MNLQLHNSFGGTILTIMLGAIGIQEVDMISKAVFTLATITTCSITTIYTYHKIQKLKNNEKDSN